jgi:hypothetical protein
MRREASHVPFLICPFCVRGALLMWTTKATHFSEDPFLRTPASVACWQNKQR